MLFTLELFFPKGFLEKNRENYERKKIDKSSIQKEITNNANEITPKNRTSKIDLLSQLHDKIIKSDKASENPEIIPQKIIKKDPDNIPKDVSISQKENNINLLIGMIFFYL